MTKPGRRVDVRYSFDVDSQEMVVRVEVMPNIGKVHPVYERTQNSQLIRTYDFVHNIRPINTITLPADCENTDPEMLDYLASDENFQRSNWDKSGIQLVDRLTIQDPIVRDAFNPKTTAGDLFQHYKMVQEARVRTHPPAWLRHM